MYLQTTETISIVEQAVEIIVPSIRERRVNNELRLDIDDLTKLLNRRAFNKQQADAEKDPNVSFIVFDVNNFGLVNKKISHSYGDKLLRLIALDIKRGANAMKAAAFRLGGDEFVVLCASVRAEYLRDQIEMRIGEFDFRDFKVSVSGAVGNTFDEANGTLQARKTARKAA